MRRVALPSPWVGCAGLVLGGLTLRLWAFGGVSFAYGSDDARYVLVAQNLAHGYLPSGESEWFGARAAFLWPVALCFRVFGASDFAAVAWPLVMSLVAVVVAYLIGRELAPTPIVGFIAAGLVAAAPLEALMATRLRPDAVMPALVGFAVWAALRASRASSRQILGWALGAGLLLGLGWAARESALVMAPIVIYAGWRAGWRAIGVGALGALAVPAALAATWRVFGRDALEPLTATAGASQLQTPWSRWSWDSSYAHYLLDGALQPTRLVFLLVPVLLVAIAIVARHRPPNALFIGAWLAWAAFYLEIGTLPNLGKSPRFLTLCSIPAALLVALAAARMSPWLGAALVAAVAVIAVAALRPLPIAEARDDDVVLLNRVVARMRTLPPAPVISPNYVWWGKLNAYLSTSRLAVPRVRDPQFLDARERRGLRRLEPLPQIADYRGGYVVTGPSTKRRGWPTNWGIARRQFSRQIPWSQLVVVARVDDAVIYRWPAG